MIYHVVTGEAVEGKDADAVRWLKKLAQHSHTVNPHAVIEILRHLDGPVNKYSWVGKVESLAAHEAGGKLFNADPQTQSIFDEGNGLFINVVQHTYEVV